MTDRLKAGTAALLLTLVLAAPALAAPSVTVRVEGESATLLARTPVTPPDAPEPHTNCSADSAANALNSAVAGNWDGQVFTSTILGESHTFAKNDYWSFWVFRGGRYQVTNGICDEKLSTGEELLAAVQIADPDTFAPTMFPLWIEGVPATVAPGVPFTVTVAATACGDCLPGEGMRVARPGATVAGVTADGQGRATIALTERGPATLRATAPGAVPSATEATCVTDGADGFCGTTVPEPGAPPPPPAPPAEAPGPDRRSPEASIAGITEQERFTRRRAPRELSGTVDETSLHAVKIGLSRSYEGRCWTFSGKRERFRRARCGHHAVFRIGDRPDWSYLLPGRLGPGRYVLDVIAIDSAFNRDRPARGRNRVVFHVR